MSSNVFCSDIDLRNLYITFRFRALTPWKPVYQIARPSCPFAGFTKACI
jgi:hypothetical protein